MTWTGTSAAAAVAASSEATLTLSSPSVSSTMARRSASGVNWPAAKMTASYSAVSVSAVSGAIPAVTAARSVDGAATSVGVDP